MSQYAAMIPFSVVGTEFENIFNAEDGSSPRSDWHEAMNMLLDRGVKPKYNEVSDRAIATAYLDVAEQRLSINISTLLFQQLYSARYQISKETYIHEVDAYFRCLL